MWICEAVVDMCGCDGCVRGFIFRLGLPRKNVERKAQNCKKATGINKKGRPSKRYEEVMLRPFLKLHACEVFLHV